MFIFSIFITISFLVKVSILNFSSFGCTCYLQSSRCCRPFETFTCLTNFWSWTGTNIYHWNKIHTFYLHWSLFWFLTEICISGAGKLDLVVVSGFNAFLRCFLCRRTRIDTLDDHCRAFFSGGLRQWLWQWLLWWWFCTDHFSAALFYYLDKYINTALWAVI